MGQIAGLLAIHRPRAGEQKFLGTVRDGELQSALCTGGHGGKQVKRRF